MTPRLIPLAVAVATAAGSIGSAIAANAETGAVIRTQATQQQDDIKLKAIIRSQLSMFYRLNLGWPRVENGGTLVQCDPLRTMAKTIAASVTPGRSIPMHITSKLIGLQTGLYETGITADRYLSYAGEKTEENVYRTLQEVREEIVDKLLEQAKKTPWLLNALKGPKTVSYPNCSMS